MPTAEQVRKFWDENPLCASYNPFPLGSREYFAFYDPLREEIESVEFSYRLHEYRAFKNKRVLDVGVGNGYVLSKYALEGAVVSGIDITPTAIELTRKRFEYLGLQADLHVAAAEALPFEDATFDCVTSMGVLHHVPDTNKAVAEIFRVLKPGGRLIVMFYHRNSMQYQFKYRLVALLKGRDMQEMVNEFDGAGNPRGDVYSKAELKRVLHQFENHEMFVGFLEGGMVLPRIGRFIPRFVLKPFARWVGWNLYAKANKPRGAAA
jgi:ubiquinone/menaquinone biosynthesis C-methylase UbiE